MHTPARAKGDQHSSFRKGKRCIGATCDDPSTTSKCRSVVALCGVMRTSVGVIKSILQYFKLGCHMIKWPLVCTGSMHVFCRTTCMHVAIAAEEGACMRVQGIKNEDVASSCDTKA